MVTVKKRKEKKANIHILVHEVRLLFVLIFVPLPYLFGWCHDIYFQL